jgi:hypothetical protein
VAIETITGHKVFLYDRGGKERIDEIIHVSKLIWTRIRDDISTATVIIQLDAAGIQNALLAQLEPGRLEIVVFRGDERVWEGPITRVKWGSSAIEVYARDIMHYADRTIMRAGYSSAYPRKESVIQRAARVARAELARKEAINPPINVVPFITTVDFPTDAGTSRVTLPYEMQLYEHIDDMAAKGGMDYTVLGRALLLWDTSRSLGQTPKMGAGDFIGEIELNSYGMELATYSASTDGKGNHGAAGNGNDPYYGEVEILFTAYDEETDDGPVPSVEELRSQAQRNQSGRNPTPVMLRIPDNSAIDMTGAWEMEHLVPGIYVPLEIEHSVRTFSQMQKLSKVTVTEDPSGETIQIVLAPASKSDDTGEPA